MKIGIFDNTPIYSVDKAWEYSRPNASAIAHRDIAKLDLPVNEFLVLNMFIESTVIEREIFTTLRNHVMWAQTSRVQNVLEFEMADEVKNDPYFEDIRAIMLHQSKTSRQDDYRLDLPLLSKTSYSISISIRSFVKVMKYIEYLSQISEPPFNKIFSNSYSVMRDCAISFGYYSEVIANYKMKEILHEFPAVKLNKSERIGNFIYASAELPVYLRAQLVRHRGISIVDDLFNIILSNDSRATLRTKVKCELAGSVDAFKEVLSKRTCWVAQYNIWSGLLSNVERLMDDPADVLPCSESGSCPFDGDAMLRFKGEDPNPPCPIHIRLKGLKATGEQKEAISKMIVSDKRPVEFWTSHLEKI